MDLLEKRQMLAVAPASDFTYTTTNGQVAITSYVGSAAMVEIPATINSLPVTSIGDNAFLNRTSLTGVTLPNSITTVGTYAFSGCSSLATVAIPQGVTRIGGFAFSNCYSLTTVTIPASVTSVVSNPFTLCTSLTTITVASDNTAYSSSDGVLYTKDGSSLLAYPWGKGAKLQTGAVTIPNGVTVIGDEAFSNCNWLTSVTIPATVTYIGNAAFWACDGLTTVDMPDSVTGTGSSVFQDCSFLRSVKLSQSLTTIEAGMFRLCSALNAITIPDGVTYIGNRAFGDCMSLTSIVIPSVVTSMGDEVFKDCTALTVVRMQGSPPTIGTAVFEGVNPSQSGVYYPAGTNGWTDTFGGLPAWPYGVPGIPTAVAGMRGNGQVQLSWTAPVSNGGSGVKDYTIQYSSNSGSSWQTFTRAASTATSATVTGLTNGTGYLFRVASVNDLGTGVYSANSLAVTPATTPGTPTAVAGVRENGEVHLSWTAPAANGGSPVKDYTIQYSSNSGSSWQTFPHAASLATSATVAGLTNGTNYLFRVASVNDVGTGLYSANSLAVTPATTPSTPTAVAGVRGNGQVQLSWMAPASNGGTAVKDYTIQYSSNSGGSWQTFTDAVSAATSATVTGLTNGTNYLFRVASVNDVGTGLYSANSSVVTPATVPSVPTSIGGVRGNGRVQLSWTAPVSDGGSAVKDYAIQYSTDGSSWQTFSHAASTATLATVTGLTNRVGYLFRIAGVSDLGTGVYASTASKITPSPVPLRPSNVAASRGNGVVRLSWNAPAATAGVPVGDYAVQYSTNGGVSWVTVRDGASTRASAVISGLTIGRDYIFRVASVGRYGSGDYSVPSGLIRPATVPRSPLRLVATAGFGQVRLSWNPPVSNGGSAITQYIVQSAPTGGRWRTATTVGADTTTATVSGLLANRSYSFRVFAVNEIGTGVSSVVVGTRTLSASPTLVRA